MPQDLYCRGCRQLFTHQHGADLFCSEKCQNEHEERRELAAEDLTTAGFTQDRDTPNVYRKGGVAITIDQVLHEGFKETLARHAAALEERALSGTESEPAGDDVVDHT